MIFHDDSLMEEHYKIIDKILRKGNCVEIKKEQNNIIIVEITRKVSSKVPIKRK